MADGYARASAARRLHGADGRRGEPRRRAARTPTRPLAGRSRSPAETAPSPATATPTRRSDDFRCSSPVTKFSAGSRRGALPDLLRQAFRAATTGCARPGPPRARRLRTELRERIRPADARPSRDAVRPSPPFRPACPSDADVDEALRQLRSSRAADDGGRRRREIVRRAGGAAGAGRAPVDPVRHSPERQGDGRGRSTRSHVGVLGIYSRALRQPDGLGGRPGVLRRQPHRRPGDLNWKVRPSGTPVIQLDIDPEELGRTLSRRASRAGRPQRGACRAARLPGARPRAAHGLARSRVAAPAKAGCAECRAYANQPAQPIRPSGSAHELSDALPDKRSSWPTPATPACGRRS